MLTLPDAPHVAVRWRISSRATMHHVWPVGVPLAPRGLVDCLLLNSRSARGAEAGSTPAVPVEAVVWIVGLDGPRVELCDADVLVQRLPRHASDRIVPEELGQLRQEENLVAGFVSRQTKASGPPHFAQNFAFSLRVPQAEQKIAAGTCCGCVRGERVV